MFWFTIEIDLVEGAVQPQRISKLLAHNIDLSLSKFNGALSFCRPVSGDRIGVDSNISEDSQVAHSKAPLSLSLSLSLALIYRRLTTESRSYPRCPRIQLLKRSFSSSCPRWSKPELKMTTAVSVKIAHTLFRIVEALSCRVQTSRR